MIESHMILEHLLTTLK